MPTLQYLSGTVGLALNRTLRRGRLPSLVNFVSGAILVGEQSGETRVTAAGLTANYLTGSLTAQL